jgi:hypothetical protein
LFIEYRTNHDKKGIEIFDSNQKRLISSAVFLAVTLFHPVTKGDTQRMAIIVGNNLGLSNEDPLKYAESEALELYTMLLEIGNLQPGNAYLALGKTSGELGSIFEEIRGRIHDAQQAQDIVLIFFYSGHASQTSLHLNNTRFELERLKKTLKELGAQAVISFIDACKSGAIIRKKGISLMPPYTVKLDSQETFKGNGKGQVFITSSGPAEVSMETEELRGSFFSHYLISGLRGDADSDKDSRIDLEEVYKYTYHNTVAKTIESQVGTQHPSYDYDLSGSGDVVITWPVKSGSILELDQNLQGSYLVINKHSRKVIAEINKTSGQLKSIALPSQSYLIKKRSNTGFLVGEVNLSWGGKQQLDENEMQFVSFSSITKKGKLPNLEHNHLYASFLTRNGIIDGNQMLFGGNIHYYYLFDEIKLGTTFSYSSGETQTQELVLPTHGLELAAEGYYFLDWENIQLDLGGYLGAMLYWQEIPALPDLNSRGASLGIKTRINWILVDPLAVMIGFKSGLEYLKKEKEYKLGACLEMNVGVGIHY